MMPKFLLYMSFQARPTAVTEVTIGRKYAVWNSAEKRSFWLSRFATMTEISVEIGTTSSTYFSVLPTACANLGSLSTLS